MIDIKEHGGNYGGKSPVKISDKNKFTYDYSYIKTREEHTLNPTELYNLSDFREVLYQDERYLVYSTNGTERLGIYDKSNFLKTELPNHPNVCLSIQRKDNILYAALYSSISGATIGVTLTKFDLESFVMISTVRYQVSQLTGNVNTSVSIISRFGKDYFACLIKQTNNYYIAIVSMTDYVILVKTMIGTTTTIGNLVFDFGVNGQDNKLYSDIAKIIMSLHDGVSKKMIEIEVLLNGSYNIRYLANNYLPQQIFEWKGKKMGADVNNLFVYDNTLSTIISNQMVFLEGVNRIVIEIDKFNDKVVALKRLTTAPNRVQILDIVDGVIVSEFYTPSSSLEYEPSGIIYNHYNQFKVYEFRTYNQSTRAPKWDQLIYGKIKTIK